MLAGEHRGAGSHKEPNIRLRSGELKLKADPENQ